MLITAVGKMIVEGIHSHSQSQLNIQGSPLSWLCTLRCNFSCWLQMCIFTLVFLYWLICRLDCRDCADSSVSRFLLLLFKKVCFSKHSSKCAVLFVIEVWMLKGTLIICSLFSVLLWVFQCQSMCRGRQVGGVSLGTWMESLPSVQLKMPWQG